MSLAQAALAVDEQRVEGALTWGFGDLHRHGIGHAVRLADDEVLERERAERAGHVRRLRSGWGLRQRLLGQHVGNSRGASADKVVVRGRLDRCRLRGNRLRGRRHRGHGIVHFQADHERQVVHFLESLGDCGKEVLLDSFLQEVVFHREEKEPVAHRLGLDAVHERVEFRLVDVVKAGDVVANFRPFFVQTVVHLPRNQSMSMSKDDLLRKVLRDPFAKLGQLVLFPEPCHHTRFFQFLQFGIGA